MVRRLVPLVALLVVTTAQLPKVCLGQEGQSQKRVTLNLENADVRHALKLLFQTVGQNYTVAPEVTGTVTASLSDVTFRTALENILRGNTKPLTYRVESGVYQIQLRPEPVEPVIEPEKRQPPLRVYQLNYASAQEVARRLMGADKALLPSGVDSLSANAAGNSLLARGTDQSLRELTEIIRILDIYPKQIELRAELLFTVTDKSGRVRRWTLDGTGSTHGEKATWLKAVQADDGSSRTRGVTTGRYSIRIQPRVNGDNTINVDFSGDLDVLWKGAATIAPYHINRSFTGSTRLLAGEAAVLFSSTVRRDEEGSKAEVRVLLTPVISTDPARTVRRPSRGVP